MFLKKTHNYFLENGGVPKPFLKKQPKEELMEKAFVFNRGYSAKSRAGSAKSGTYGGYGQKSDRTKESSIIKANIMAVKNHNTYNLSSNAGDVTQYTKGDGDLSDTMPQGAKFGNESVSGSNVHTNYTKNRQNYATMAESQGADAYDNKKTKKGKKLPKIFDEHRVTPKI